MLGFPHAVVKKYGDDAGGRQAALITYYGFLSIFPLLLLAVAVLSRVLADHPDLRPGAIMGAAAVTVLLNAGTPLLARLVAASIRCHADITACGSGRNHPGKGDATSEGLEKAAGVTVRDPRPGGAPMMSATSNPARSAAGHYMKGRGHGLIVLASVLLA